MKKIQYIALASLLFLGSCDSLDLAPIDYSAAGNYWKNEAQVTSFMDGLHSQLRTDYQSPVVLGEVRGGTLRDGTSSMNVSLNYARLITNTLDKDNTGISNWNGYYSKILQVNHFIEQVESGCDFMSSDKKNALLGQAYGIRAYYYFMLYRTYGGVPIEKEVKVLAGNIDINNLYMARATAEETLNFIKEDVKKSEDYFGNNETIDRLRWSRYATLLLKAGVYMWSAKVTTNDETGKHTATGKADLEVARTALQTIISSGKFSLIDNFADVFSFSNKKNNEVILEMPFDKDEITNWSNVYVYQASLFVGTYFSEDGKVYDYDPLDLCGGGYGRIEYKESFIKTYDQTDSRRSATFFEYYSSADPATRSFGAAMKKQLGHIADGTRYYDSDIIMYRYADVLLKMAEVENGLGNSCASYINQVRQRAYGANFDASVTYSDGSYAENELAILHERDKEFVSEGCRWFDVVRMHDANNKSLAFSPSANYPAVYGSEPSALISSNEDYKLLWPIDTNVLSGDKQLKQTYGY